mgnify:CR=1 FL=1
MMTVVIRQLDISTPSIYSLRFDEEGVDYYVLIEILSDHVNALIRQVLAFDKEMGVLIDRTLDDDVLDLVKRRISGFMSGRSVMTWNDVLVQKIFDSVLFVE